MNNKDTKNLVQNMKFEIDPLDINLVKIQQEFQKKVEQIPNYGNFTPLIGLYESKDPTRNISKIIITCKNLEDETNKLRTLELRINNKQNLDETIFTLAKGNKQEIIDIINDKKFFEICKSLIIKTENTLENK